jgi:ABC-type transport system involved in cytochrome c biogenesis permease subunit
VIKISTFFPGGCPHGAGKALASVFFAFLLILPTTAEIQNFQAAARIAIQENGRIQPLDTFARNLLLQFSGKSTFEKKSAVQWLCSLLFSPESTRNDKFFQVKDMQTIQAMGLSNLPPAKRFSYKELEKGLEKLRELAVNVSKVPHKTRTPLQNELLGLFHNVNLYINLASAFQFTLPVDEFSIRDSALATILGLAPAPAKHSYYDMLNTAGRLHGFLTGLQSKAPEALTGLEKEVMALTRRMFQWSNYYKNMPVHLLPPVHNREAGWLSPWDVIHNQAEKNALAPEIRQLAILVKAYLNDNQENFDRAAAIFSSLVEKHLQDESSLDRIGLELTYNRADFFYWSEIIYGLGMLFLLVFLVLRLRALYWMGIIITSAGILPHSAGIILRMIITGRPPVTNLYETFVFTALMAVILGLVTERLQQRVTGALTAAFSGLTLLLISGKYAMEGDTMGMLVAVLDSNFWLTVHVITVTMGYAGCCAAGVAGHFYILQSLFRPNKEKQTSLYKSLYGILAFGAVFTFIGTITGGIWADQSWGRFWGWDPKENGALLIVLWTAILFHAKLAGLISELGMAVGSILTIICVMFAWFGVNLLGVGLHSYGFSSGVFMNLVVFISVELGFIVVSTTWILGRKRGQRLAA